MSKFRVWITQEWGKDIDADRYFIHEETGVLEFGLNNGVLVAAFNHWLFIQQDLNVLEEDTNEQPETEDSEETERLASEERISSDDHEGGATLPSEALPTQD